MRLVFALAGIAAVIAWAWQARPAAFNAPWHGLLVPGAVLCLLSLLVYAARFRCVMRMLELDASFVASLRIVSFAVFCQFFVPLGAGAELGKFLKLRGLAPERRALVSAAVIALEHGLGLLALLAMASLLFACLHPLAVVVDPRLVAGVALLIATAAVVVVLRRQGRAGLGARQLLARLGAHRRDAALVLLLSMLMHALLAGAVYVGSRGWYIDIAYWQILFVLVTAAVVQAVPATLVGVGVADLAGGGLYVALGLPWSESLLLVSLLYCYRLLVAVLGGLWEMDEARRVWRGEEHQDETKAPL